VKLAEIYTDGSCHTQQCVGAWAAIVLHDGKKTILSGVEKNTTHNRMELLAVIRSLKHFNGSGVQIRVVSDSQYVVGLNARKAKLQKQDFTTAAGKEVRNADLVKEFFLLSKNVNFVKIKAHQKKTSTTNYNIEADVLVRKLMRELTT
jgi:ribonuclease HI